MKTSELAGAQLDWAVAKCEPEMLGIYYTDDNEPLFIEEAPDYHQEWAPSTNWAQGGPIIERECISIEHCNKDTSESPWGACSAGWKYQFGPAPLIAAMRCYVASKLGDEVEIPKELT